jgi:cytochrome c2
MRRSYFRLLVVVTLALAWSVAQPAAAVVQFYMEYKKLLLDTHSDKEYATTVNKVANRCLICHQGKLRKNHNAFGKHLVPLLDRKTDLRDKEKIIAAIKKVVEMHVNPDDDKSETYLDRIRASKWPGGELEELKKEPPEEKTEQAAQ